MSRLLLCLLFVLSGEIALAADDPVVVIAHRSVPKVDLSSLQRLYTGRVVSISQQSAVPVSLPPGHPVRDRFLEAIMGQNEEQYTGYWLVRRYVGKGAPPQEMATVEELVQYVTSTPGAVGYVPLSKVPPGGNVIFRR